jgi:hypothetical protein
VTTDSQNQNGAAPTTTQALTPYQERQINLRDQISQDSTPRAIVPRTLAEVRAFADMMANSSLVPEALRERAADISMIMMAGAEIGIPPIKSLGLYHVMDGVPKLSADGLAAVTTASALCEYLEPVEQSNERVTWRARRKGRQEITLTWTDADVKLANLDRPSRNGVPSNHVKYPRAMKNARCKAELARLVWPDICAGIVTAEEARDIAWQKDLEQVPPTSTMSAPPQPLPPPIVAGPSNAKTDNKSGKAKAAPTTKPIDVASTEKPVTPSPASSTNSGSTSSATPSPSSSSAVPADPAREEALRQAGENAREIERVRQEQAGNVPTTEERTPSATTEDVAPQGVASDASDGFGGDDSESAEEAPEFTMPKFEKGLADIVKRKAAAELAPYKARWVPWSKIEGEGGGKAHAHVMRDLFAKASTDLGVR